MHGVILQIPLVMEQRLTTDRTIQQGLAIGGSAKKATYLVGALKEMLKRQDELTTNAQAFAAKYAKLDPAAQIEKVVSRLEELVA